ncbi:plectin [Oryctolagus cuniculus]|uniref:plectin n=1 Tax=Oryctolagus cuniculus TaxID=9986 RepID=UPI003879A135
MECGKQAGTGAGLGQATLPAPGALTVSPQPPAMLTVVVEVELSRDSGSGTCGPTLLPEGLRSLRLHQQGTLETQEAEQELLARVQATLGSVSQGYSVALLLRGRETEAPRLVPQLLHLLFEEAQPLSHSDPVLTTLSLVQLSPSGRTRDLLSPATENLSVLDVAPLGLVGEGASEVAVSDSRAASELYLQATAGEGRDCPLLQVLAGEVTGEEVEGCLPWIVSRLLEGNNYSGLLLRLDPQGSSLSLLQAALLGASERRTQAKQVRPTLWDAVEEARVRRAGLKTLRLGLLGDTLTESRLSQLGKALRELQVVKAWSQPLRSQTFQRARAEAGGLPEPQVKGEPLKYFNQGRQQCSYISAARTATLRSGLHPQHPLGDTEEQAQKAPDVALQFFLAQARRQRLREQHQIRIQEELKRLEQEEKEVASEQDKDLVTEEEACEARRRWRREQTVLRLQLDALQAERDSAEQDLAALYDLHVRAAQAQTCHMLQVFRAWQRLWEEKAMTTERHHRSLLAGVLQDNIKLATQNQELQAQNWQFQQGTD